MNRSFLETDMDVIELRGLRADCIVGIYPAERKHAQRLEVDLALYLDTREAAAGGGLKASLDYARLAGEIRFLLESCRFRLLESAAEALCRYVLAPPTEDAPRAAVQAVTVRVTKPQALGGEVIPSLQIHRRASEMVYEIEEKPFGRVDVVHVSQGCGIYRLRVAAGRSIPTHVHEVMEESELILGGGLLLQGHRVKPGSAYRWPKGAAHRYDNPSATEQTILCVDRPSFIPTDEIEVATPEGGFTRVEPLSFYPDEAGQER